MPVAHTLPMVTAPICPDVGMNDWTGFFMNLHSTGDKGGPAYSAGSSVFHIGGPAYGDDVSLGPDASVFMDPQLLYELDN